MPIASRAGPSSLKTEGASATPFFAVERAMLRDMARAGRDVQHVHGLFELRGVVGLFFVIIYQRLTSWWYVMVSDLEKSVIGSWLLHHDQKLQSVQTTEFESIARPTEPQPKSVLYVA